MEGDVQLCVVRVLDVVDAEGCDHVSDRCDVQAEQDRPENWTLRYPELDGRWSRLLIPDPHELGPLCQIRPDPIQRTTVYPFSSVDSGLRGHGTCPAPMICMLLYSQLQCVPLRPCVSFWLHAREMFMSGRLEVLGDAHASVVYTSRTQIVQGSVCLGVSCVYIGPCTPGSSTFGYRSNPHSPKFRTVAYEK